MALGRRPCVPTRAPAIATCEGAPASHARVRQATERRLCQRGRVLWGERAEHKQDGPQLRHPARQRSAADPAAPAIAPLEGGRANAAPDAPITYSERPATTGKRPRTRRNSVVRRRTFVASGCNGPCGAPSLASKPSRSNSNLTVLRLRFGTSSKVPIDTSKRSHSGVIWLNTGSLPTRCRRTVGEILSDKFGQSSMNCSTSAGRTTIQMSISLYSSLVPRARLPQSHAARTRSSSCKIPAMRSTIISGSFTMHSSHRRACAAHAQRPRRHPGGTCCRCLKPARPCGAAGTRAGNPGRPGPWQPNDPGLPARCTMSSKDIKTQTPSQQAQARSSPTKLSRTPLPPTLSARLSVGSCNVRVDVRERWHLRDWCGFRFRNGQLSAVEFASRWSGPPCLAQACSFCPCSFGRSWEVMS
jgi:hypothetical protein